MSDRASFEIPVIMRRRAGQPDLEVPSGVYRPGRDAGGRVARGRGLIERVGRGLGLVRRVVGVGQPASVGEWQPGWPLHTVIHPVLTAGPAGIKGLPDGPEHPVGDFRHRPGDGRAGGRAMTAPAELRREPRAIDVRPRPERHFHSAACLLDEQETDLHTAQADREIHQIFSVRWDRAGSQKVVAADRGIGQSAAELGLEVRPGSRP